MKFTWNPDRARKVKSEHKIEFDKVKDVFNDPFAVEFNDHNHSTEEEFRYAIIGLSAEYGLVYLVFTEISETHLHFITARKAENWMVNEYEQNKRRV